MDATWEIRGRREVVGMLVVEGETKSYAEDIRTTELAIIDRSSANHDNVTVIPETLLTESRRKGTAISDEQLPFEIKVLEYFQLICIY